MWIVLFFVSCTSLLVKGFGNEEILGKGRWFIISTMQCEDPERYALDFHLTRRKINRTHDAFSAHINLDRELNATYGVEILADKEVDGGFKLYHKQTDESFCNLVKKYCGDNFPKLLTAAKVDPPDCPIPEGDLQIEDFVIDYRELQETGVYGTYDAHAYLTYMAQRVACMRLHLNFEKEYEDEDDDDEDDYS